MFFYFFVTNAYVEGLVASYALSTIGKALIGTAMAVNPLHAAIFHATYAESRLRTSPANDFFYAKLKVFLPANNKELKFVLKFGLETANLVATVALIVFATSYIAPSVAISYRAAFAILGVIGAFHGLVHL